MAGEGVIDVTPKQDGGVLKEILKAGEGEDGPLAGDKVFVHYVGTLEADGSKFDSSRDRDDRFSFTLGKGEVIKAWDLGVATMKKGELAKFTCKSEYAYGAQGSPPKIPANATLIFEVELFEWQGEDLSQKNDGGIIRRNVVPGEGYQTPNEGALLEVHIVGKVNGTVFDDRKVKFPLGEGSEHNIPEGLETALEKFKKGEKSIIKLSPEYGYGSEGNSTLGVPPGAALVYEVELQTFEKSKESWEMDQEEKIVRAKACKDRGTTFLKQEKYQLAVKQYKKIIDLLEFDSGLDEEKKVESERVLLAGHLNLAMVFLKLNQSSLARDHATKAIDKDNSNIKAYFRRGQALLNLGENDGAQADFQRCLDIEQNNKAAKQQLQICLARIKSEKLKEKQLYGGMFDKFAKQDMQKKAANKKTEVKDDPSNTEEKGDTEMSEKIC